MSLIVKQTRRIQFFATERGRASIHSLISLHTKRRNTSELINNSPKKLHCLTYSVYACKDNQTIVRANRPVNLLRNSIVTPTLAAGIPNGKYINALPLYRLEQEFARNDIHISRQVMANWTMQCAERYLSLPYLVYLQSYIIKLLILKRSEVESLNGPDYEQNSVLSFYFRYLHLFLFPH